MGLLVDGVWHDRWYDTAAAGGRFVRAESRFRDRVGADGSTGFPAAPGRYHLYVQYACPWAHRTLIVRALKRLEGAISVSSLEPVMGPDGWAFGPPGTATGDPLHGAAFLRDIYLMADPRYTGRVTVPVLWDTVRRTIVNNESAEIVRMLNAEFDAWGNAALDLYPPALSPEIDRINARIYETVNNGVYRAGFATTQGAYDEAFDALFATLDWLDERLGRQRYLVGDRPTEADWRLFTTLVRFDAVYALHFKCNRRRLVDYPNLWPYVRDLYQVPGVAETVRMRDIKVHYYRSHPTVDPTGIVPKGPEIDFLAPHGRDRPWGA